MRLTRREDISLYLYLKDVVIGPQFSEVSIEQPLTKVGTSLWDIAYDLDYGICPVKRGDSSGLGRGLLYFDVINDTCVVGKEQTSMLVITDGLTTLSGYTVNYKTGQVVTDLDLTNYSADYYWNYVAVVDAWPYQDVADLPIVSLELQTAENLPYQLGYGHIREAYWNIQVFAPNKGVRDDLVDVIFEGVYLKRCPLYTLSSGLPLQQRGTFNSNFSAETIPEYSALIFEEVDKKLTGLPSWGFYEAEVLNKYRAEINLRTRVYKG